MSWKDRLRKQVQEKAQDGGTFWSLDTGFNTYRPLPHIKWQVSNLPSEDLPTIFMYDRHYLKVGEAAAFVTCGHDENYGSSEGRCLLCDVVFPKAQARGNESDKKMLEDARVQTTAAMCISPVVDGKFRAPKIFEFAVNTAKSWGYKLVDIITSPKRFVEHPVKGHNICTEKKGQKMQTTYDHTVEEDATTVPKEIFNARLDVESFIRPYNEDLIKKILRGEKPTADDLGYGHAEEPASDYSSFTEDDYGTAEEQTDDSSGEYTEEYADSTEDGAEEVADDYGYAEESGEETTDDYSESADAAEPAADGDDSEADPWADIEEKPAPAARKQAAPPARKQAAAPPPAKKQAAPPPPPARKQAPPPPPPARNQAAPPPPPPARKQAAPPARKQAPPARKQVK